MLNAFVPCIVILASFLQSGLFPLVDGEAEAERRVKDLSKGTE